MSSQVQSNADFTDLKRMLRPTSYKEVLFWGLLIVPHIAYFLYDTPAYTHQYTGLRDELSLWWKLTLDGVQVWGANPFWYLTALATFTERISYYMVWTRAEGFRKMCKNSEFLRARGSPVDVLHQLFLVFKTLQIGGLLMYYVMCAPIVDFGKLSLLRLLVSVQLIGLGQVLNAAIFIAIGKAGVYYGCRLGQPVPWFEGFPFTVIRHPQYVGVLMTLLGSILLLGTAEHAEKGLLGLFIFQIFTYCWTMLVEDKL